MKHKKYSFVETKLHRVFTDFCSEQAACHYEMNFSHICYDCNLRSIEKKKSGTNYTY